MGDTRKNLLKNLLLALISMLICLSALEVALNAALSHPDRLVAMLGRENRLLRALQRYYVNFDRAVIHFSPQCARYDPELSYTLRPGNFVYRNREVEVDYQVNSEGLRGDEETLSSFNVMVLGDSQAMGWGVSQKESFPARLGWHLSTPVLNAAISSYGTAREVLLLRRLMRHNHPEFRAIIIQYCGNDFPENKQYLNGGFRLQVMSEEEYREVADYHERTMRYYPGKILWHLSPFAPSSPSRAARSRPSSVGLKPSSANEEAEVFLDVLLHNRDLLAGKCVVALEISRFEPKGSAVIAAAQQLVGEERYRDVSRQISFLDVNRVLSRDDYYLLDDHLRAKGLDKVARMVAAELRRRNWR